LRFTHYALRIIFGLTIVFIVNETDVIGERIHLICGISSYAFFLGIYPLSIGKIDIILSYEKLVRARVGKGVLILSEIKFSFVARVLILSSIFRFKFEISAFLFFIGLSSNQIGN
jgi:hypothetical protein